jgi:hypothetical protein
MQRYLLAAYLTAVAATLLIVDRENSSVALQVLSHALLLI